MSQITEQKFQEIYKEYYKRLFCASEKIVKDAQRAEDVIHEVFIRLYKQDFSKIEDHVHEWLFIVCRNCSIKQYHKKNRYAFLEDMKGLDCIDESADASEGMIQNELSKSMIKLLKKLSKKQQKAIKLRYFQDYSYDVIAKKMDTTIGNVGYMLSNAISRLKIFLEEENKKKGLY